MSCTRCHEGYLAPTGRCTWCGVASGRRVVRHLRRRTKIGGKHGRNSGKVSQHGKAGG